MSDDVTFKGKFSFKDRVCLMRGLAGFVDRMQRHQGIHELGWLRIHELSVSIDFDGSTPASWYESMKSALWALGLYANAGDIETSYTYQDDTWSEAISHGACASAEDRTKPNGELVQEVEKWLAASP